MRKRLLSLFLAMTMVVLMTPSVSAATDTITGEGWTQIGSPEGTVEVSDEVLKLSSNTTFSTVGAVNTQNSYGDFTAEFTYHFVAGGNNDAAVFLYRASTDAATGYAVYFVNCGEGANQYYIKLASMPYTEMKAGMFFNNGGYGVAYNSDVQVKVVVSGATHSLYVTMPGEEYGEPIYIYTEEAPRYTEGYVGFMQWQDSVEHTVTTAFSNLSVTPDERNDLNFTQYSVSLSDGLEMNFVADSYVLATKGYTDLMATFEINGQKFTVKDYKVKNGYIFTLENIRPDWIHENITVTLTATLNGETVTSIPKTYSITNYCRTLLSYPTTGEKLKTLLVDILNYGSAAQVYTKNDADQLANSGLSSAELALATAYKDAISQKKLTDEPTESKATWTGAAVYLRDSVRLKMRFNSSVSSDLAVLVKFDGQTWIVDQSEMTKDNGDYLFFFDEIMPNDMRKPVEMVVTENGVAISKKITYSVQSYVANAVAQNSDENLVGMLKAMLAYADGASAYMKSMESVQIPSTLDMTRFESQIINYEAYPVEQGAVLMYGSSFFANWGYERAKTQWASGTNGALQVVNHGFGGATVYDLMYYYDRMVTPYQPSAFVFRTGVNDIFIGCTPEESWAMTERLIEWVKEDYPEAKLVFVKVFDAPAFNQLTLNRVHKYNSLLEAYANATDSVYCVDINAFFYENEADIGTGKNFRDVFLSDNLHLTDAAYEEMANYLPPMVQAILEDEA